MRPPHISRSRRSLLSWMERRGVPSSLDAYTLPRSPTKRPDIRGPLEAWSWRARRGRRPRCGRWPVTSRHSRIAEVCSTAPTVPCFPHRGLSGTTGLIRNGWTRAASPDGTRFVAIGAGRRAVDTPKGRRQMRLAAEPHGERHIRDRLAAAPEELCGALEPSSKHILMR